MGDYQSLTEKQKEALRLLLDGHDAKSAARQLGLSVHTINERLRDARRKLAVSSSKEAARLLKRHESSRQPSADKLLGDADPRPTDQASERPDAEIRRPSRARWALGGLVMIILVAAMLAASGAPNSANVTAPSTPAGERAPDETAASAAARQWLVLVDQGRWLDSWNATGRSFQSLNTAAAWQAASEQARVPLGRVLSRTLLSERSIPAPPNGYQLVQFRTEFANKGVATETLSLARDADGWKVVGIYIE